MDFEKKFNIGGLDNPRIWEQLDAYGYKYDAEDVDKLERIGLMITTLHGEGYISFETYKALKDKVIQQLKNHLILFGNPILSSH